MMRRRTTTLTAPENGQGYGSIMAPEPVVMQSNARSSDLVKVEENTQLHIAAMDAHEQKAEEWIGINFGIVDKSGEAFSSFARSSEERVKAAQKTMFEPDVQVAEHSLRQSLMDGLSGNVHSTARVTGILAAISVLPREEPKKTLLQRVFGS